MVEGGVAQVSHPSGKGPSAQTAAFECVGDEEGVFLGGTRTPGALAVSGPASRVAWVDYSKGICIFLVVMLHANGAVGELRGATGWLDHVVAFARPFRMPDFFLIAGLFLHRTIERPWRTYLEKKVLHFAYFYALWATLQFGLFTAREALLSGQSLAQIGRRYLWLFVQPDGSLWFIHSLAVYFVIVRLTRRAPRWLMLAVCGGLQIANVDTGWTVVDEFARRFVYFYSGYALSTHVFRIADWGFEHGRGMLGYLLAWGVVNQVCVARGWAALPGAGLALGYLGAIAVVFFGVLLSRAPATGWLRYLGENSIVVYLGYYVCERALLKLGVGLTLDVGSAALVLTLGSVLGALALFWTATRAGVTFPYRRPRRVRVPPPAGVPEARPLAA